MRKWLVRIAVGVFCLAGLASAGVYWVIASEYGTRWLLNTAVEFSRQQIELTGISGNLLSPLYIEQAQYTHCSTDVDIRSLEIRWHLENLLEKKFNIKFLSAASLAVASRNGCGSESTEEFVLPDKISIPVSIEVDRLLLGQIEISGSGTPQTITNLIGQLKTQSGSDGDQLTIKVDNVDYDALNAQAQLSGTLGGKYPMDGEFEWQFNSQPDTESSGTGSFGGDLNELEVSHSLNAPYQINTTAKINQLLSGLNFQAENIWETITIPAGEGIELVLRNGKLGVQGSVTQPEFNLQSSLDTPYANGILVSATGNITPETLVLSQFDISHQVSRLNASGNINIKDPLSAQLKIGGNSINPALILSDYPGNLDLDATLKYTEAGESRSLDINIVNLAGQLREFPVLANGLINTDLSRYQIDNVRISVGDNNIFANGSFHDTVDLEVNIDAPSIGQLLSGSDGDVHGSIKMHGEFRNPGLEAELHSSYFSFNNQIELTGISTTAMLDGLENEDVQARVEVGEIKIQENVLSKFHLNVSGTQQQHQISGSVDTEYGQASIDTSGSFDTNNRIWEANIQKLILRDSPLGDWRNSQSADLLAGEEQQSLSKLCLENSGQIICLDYQGNSADGKSIEINIEDLNLDNFQAQFPENMSLEGTVYATADLQSGDSNEWTGKIDFGSNKLKLSPAGETKIDEELIFSSFDANLLLEETSSLKAKFSSNRGQGSASFIVESLQQGDQADITEGMIELTIPDLKFANPYLNGVVIDDGKLAINLLIDGPLKDPAFQGNGLLQSLDFSIPELGINYQDASLELSAPDPSSLQLEGVIKSDSGNMSIGGHISLGNEGEFDYKFDINGDNFQVMEKPKLAIKITPSLVISGNATQARISGDLLIPKMSITLNELPEGIASVSNDEIIISDDTESNIKSRFRVLADIDLTLGDDIAFSGFGLNTGLEGRLRLTLGDNQITQGYGNLQLRDAEYSILGQVMEIKKGKLLFSGPVNDPSLDILIQRLTDDVEVNMSITGKTDDPTTQLNSDPAMSEANKLSYLISGRPAQSLDGGEGNLLASTALALGLNKTSPALQELGTQLGFDTVTIGGGESSLESTSLLLGKHLSPNLYITYARDVFAGLGAVQMNYKLHKNLSLEAVSGEEQTIDLIYSIDK